MTRIRNGRLAQALAAMGMVTLASCGGGGGGDPAPVQVPTAPALQAAVNARYQIVITDAVTGAQITDPLSLTFSSNATLRAPDGTSLAGKTVTTGSGLFAVEAIFTSAANEFSVQVKDGATNGWIASGTRVVGESGQTGDREISIKLLSTKNAAAINASSQPVAVAVVTATTGAGGALQSAVVAQTTPKTVTNADGATVQSGVASLSIGTGTVARTESGTPAAAGALTVASTYYATANPQALETLPGGYAASVAVPTGNTALLNGVAPEDAVMQVAGFAQFNVTDSAGQPIKTFDKPVSLSIDLPKTTLDADDQPVKAGDEFPVWSYDENAGKWVFEKMGLIKEKAPVDPNNFAVEFQTTHLSSWTLSVIKGSCTANVRLAPTNADDNRPLEVNLFGSTNFIFIRGIKDRQITLYKAPSQTMKTITVYDRGVKIGEITNRSLCSAQVVPITLPTRSFGTLRTEVSESCPDGSQSRGVPAYVSITGYGGYATVPSGSTGPAVYETRYDTTGGGAVQVYVQNPRTWVYSRQNVTVPTNGSATVKFNFPLTCSQVTGASGG